VPEAVNERRPPGEVTELLLAWSGGKQSALDRLVPLMYPELRRLAHGCMRGEREDHILQTSALINEAYLRLVDSARVKWQDRAHFLAVSAKLMRRILVDFARSRQSHKRGEGARLVPLNTALNLHHMRSRELVKLDDALNELAKVHPRRAKVIEMRFFGGLSVEETAEVLGVSPETVMRDWRIARAWLHRALSGGSSDGQ
jgi:RNA polymerase sigma-70 factor (ECF subfamily)